MTDLFKTIDKLARERARVAVYVPVCMEEATWTPITMQNGTIEIGELCALLQKYFARYSDMEKDFDDVLINMEAYAWSNKEKRRLAIK